MSHRHNRHTERLMAELLKVFLDWLLPSGRKCHQRRR
jgi:hypothetical protein